MSSAQKQRITEDEQRKYWEIFTALNPINGYLTGIQAKQVLENSQLENDQLELIWDLADVDNDGNLDFEEFCVAMRLIFDVINGIYPAVPKQLPDFLIPSSKAHLVAANKAISTGLDLERPSFDDDDDYTTGLSNDFDWYISPSDQRDYEHIYSANANRHGQISFNSLSEFYSTIDVPDSDIRRAWNLINPKDSEYINKDATLYFLHILKQRHQRVRVPKSVPASLRATLNQGNIDYDVSHAKIGRGKEEDVPVRRARDKDNWESTTSSKKDDFAAGYLSRLGVGEGSSKYNSTGNLRLF
jgi:actin cytoskeleton-regulatory complex protein END3